MPADARPPHAGPTAGIAANQKEPGQAREDRESGAYSLMLLTGFSICAKEPWLDAFDPTAPTSSQGAARRSAVLARARCSPSGDKEKRLPAAHYEKSKSRYDSCFINPELTVHFRREPRGEWICLDAETANAEGGAGLATATLSDDDGVVPYGAQSLLVSRRPPR